MTETIRIGGTTMRFLHDKDRTAGSLDMFEMTVLPGGSMPVPHYHESWDETVYGLAGSMRFTVDGAAIDIGPGGTVFIRRGIVHGFANVTDAPATVLGVLSPGVLGIGYFRAVAVLAANGPPDEAEMATLMRAHGLVPAG